MHLAYSTAFAATILLLPAWQHCNGYYTFSQSVRTVVGREGRKCQEKKDCPWALFCKEKIIKKSSKIA